MNNMVLFILYDRNMANWYYASTKLHSYTLIWLSRIGEMEWWNGVTSKNIACRHCMLYESKRVAGQMDLSYVYHEHYHNRI